MENGNADPSIRIDVGVKYVRDKLHLGRVQRVALGETQPGHEYTVLERSSLWSCDDCFPLKKVFFCSWPCCNAIGWIVGNLLEFCHQPTERRACHFTIVLSQVEVPM